jgi:hypothetical protein
MCLTSKLNDKIIKMPSKSHETIPLVCPACPPNLPIPYVCTVLYIISEPPYFLREPDDVVAVAGTDTMLECQVQYSTVYGYMVPVQDRMINVSAVHVYSTVYVHSYNHVKWIVPIRLRNMLLLIARQSARWFIHYSQWCLFWQVYAKNLKRDSVTRWWLR